MLVCVWMCWSHAAHGDALFCRIDSVDDVASIEHNDSSVEETVWPNESQEYARYIRDSKDRFGCN
jgi:hypothetical protein